MPKTCRSCGIELGENNQYKRRQENICKPCRNKYSAAWLRKHPEKDRQYKKNYQSDHPGLSTIQSKRYRARVRAEIIAGYGGKCVQCGIDNPILLDIDHINNGAKADRERGLAGMVLWTWLKRNNYPKDNYQLLCRNCNWLKYIEAKEIHGAYPPQKRPPTSGRKRHMPQTDTN